MFIKTSEKIAQILKETNTIDEDNFEICRYGIQQGITIILNIVTTMLIGIFLDMFWQAIIFSILYIPLRSNAGGFHASTALRCYIFSIISIIIVLLAIKYIVISKTICLIITVISLSIILYHAPIEDSNKKLDEIEHKVYKRRSIKISLAELLAFFVVLRLDFSDVYLCIMNVFICESIIILLGIYNNKKVFGN